MKKIFFSLLAIAAIASCAKTEPVYTEIDSEIKLAPVTSLTTKAIYNEEDDKVYNAIDGTAYPAKEDFKVTAYWNGIAADQKNVVYLDDVTFVNKGQYWGGETTYYWPKNGDLRFAAYSPATVEGVEHSVTNDLYNVTYTQPSETAKTVDFMIAPITEPYTAQTATENVAVVFEHALSWITIKVKAANPEAAQAFTIHDVIVEDAFTKGTLAAEMGDGIQYDEWSGQEAEDDYEVVKGKEIAVTTVAEIVEDTENGTVVIPQVPTTLTINYTQNAMDGTPELGSQTVNVPLELDDESNNKWEPGKHYIYTVIFDLDEILINPSVADWEDVVVEDKDSDDAGQIATVATEEELKAALAAKVPEIEVTADIALTAQLAIDYNVAITGGRFTGETIAVTGGVVSFKDVAFANATGEKQTSVYVRDGNTNVTFENCTFDAYTWEAIQVTSENSLWVCVDGCTFNGEAHRDLHLQVKNASKAEVKITNNIFNGDDADSYVTIYGYEHERMILANNVTENPANTTNVWISDVFNEYDLTLEGFVEPTKPEEVTTEISKSTILAGDVTTSSLALGSYDLDGAGYVLTMDPASTDNYFITASEGQISNLNVVGYNEYVSGTNKSTRGIVFTNISGNVVLNNVTVTDFGYSINTTTGTANTYTLTAVDCVLEGWCSWDIFKSAKFINTSFTIGDYFEREDANVEEMFNGGMRPYVPTVFENCSFDKGFYISLAKTNKITFTNCTVEGVKLTAENVDSYLSLEGEDWTGVVFN